MRTSAKQTLLGKIHRLEVFIDSRMQQGCEVYQLEVRDAADSEFALNTASESFVELSVQATENRFLLLKIGL